MVEGNLLDPALLILHNPAYQLVREYHLDSRYQIFFQPLTHVSASKNAVQLMSSVASCQENCNIYLQFCSDPLSVGSLACWWRECPSSATPTLALCKCFRGLLKYFHPHLNSRYPLRYLRGAARPSAECAGTAGCCMRKCSGWVECVMRGAELARSLVRSCLITIRILNILA